LTVRNIQPLESDELRHRAEMLLGENTVQPRPPKTEVELQRLYHELQVHQVELEMQNSELRQTRHELETALVKYTDLYEFAPTGYFTLDHIGTICDVNLTGSCLVGVERSRLINKCFGNFLTDDTRAFFTISLERFFTSSTKMACEVTLLNGGITPLFMQVEGMVAASGQECRIALIDITERKRVEAESKRLMAAITQTGEVIVMTDAQGTIQFVNPAFERTTGYSREEAIGQNSRFLKSGEQDEQLYRNLWDTISDGRTWTGRLVNKRKDGSIYTEEATISPVRDASGSIINYVAVQRDITEHLRLSAQFQQAQKMEAVGLLAGGVAHDYNNMLTVITGYAELALGKVDPTHQLHSELEQILNAARRSTDITKQLLAFARKQTINPVVIDLNDNVESMLKMLRRLIGEDINLAWIPAEDLYPVKLDPIQVNQILANLCVNARDAITDIGKVTLETGNATFDEAYCSYNAGYVIGDYALLAVSDDGCGMDKRILSQIFEPFFTSKEMGHGTGLGLSTVYGIIKQNNGFINVYSEPGKGTTFRMYFPRHANGTVMPQREAKAEIPLSLGETVLVVEDEPTILVVEKMLLEGLGYRVLTANTPGEALMQAREHAREIHLVITDVVMPEMNGRVLAERLQALHPTMKILFMSGYTADVIAHRGVLDEGVNFIQKPFSMKELAVKVREALSEK